MTNIKISIIGFDGLSINQLKYLSKEYRIFNYLWKNSLIRILKSIPPTTPIGWTSLITGVNPAKHGIWGFTKVNIINNAFSYRLVNSYDVKFPRLFEITAIHGLSSIIINYPLTYPLKSIYLKNNTIISDSLLGYKIECYPSTLSIGDISECMNTNIIKKTESIVKISEKLSSKYEWNLLICIFDIPDKIFHKDHSIAFKIREKYREAFNVISDFIKEIKRTCDYLFIISDHGISIYNKWVDPLALLYKSGIFSQENPIRLRILQRIVRIIYGNKLLAPSHLIINKILFSKIFRNIINNNIQLKTLSANKSVFVDVVDPWNTWIIYFKSTRERELAAQILLKYKEWLRVFNVKEYFRGPHKPKAPALLIIPNYDKGIYISLSYSKLFEETNILYKLYGAHHPYGVFLAHGKNIKENSRKFSEYIYPYDLAPTVLSILNLPLPVDSDGRTLPITKTYEPMQHKKCNYKILLKIRKLKKVL